MTKSALTTYIVTVDTTSSATGSPSTSRRPFFIGVAGGSNSGKTTLARRLSQMLGHDDGYAGTDDHGGDHGGDHGADQIVLLPLDAYYARRPGEPIEVSARANYDHPDAFDWSLLHDHLDQLERGQGVDMPVYDFATFDRTDETTPIPAAKVVIVEGILVLWEPALRERLDLKLFVDAPADLRLIRRLERDVAERARTVDSVIAQYITTVRPAHETFIEPSKRYADVIIPDGGHNQPAIDILLARLRELSASDSANTTPTQRPT